MCICFQQRKWSKGDGATVDPATKKIDSSWTWRGKGGGWQKQMGSNPGIEVGRDGPALWMRKRGRETTRMRRASVLEEKRRAGNYKDAEGQFFWKRKGGRGTRWEWRTGGETGEAGDRDGNAGRKLAGVVTKVCDRAVTKF